MDNFNAEGFVDRLSRGEFDGHVLEELRKLSHEQLAQVASLMMERLDAGALSVHDGGNAVQDETASS